MYITNEHSLAAYNCQQGDCGTCMVKINGRKAKACQASVPSGKCNIETL